MQKAVSTKLNENKNLYTFSFIKRLICMTTFQLKMFSNVIIHRRDNK